jgi:pseudomonalisin
MQRHITLAAVLAAAAGSALAIGVAAPAQASGTTTWSATATQAVPAITGATEVGPLAGSTPVSVTVGLALRNQPALQSFIAGESSPTSPDFGEAYTPSSFTAEFGPTATSVDAVESYLSSEGFTDVSASSNDLLVTATGTAAEAEQAFDTTLTEFSLDGSHVFANTTAAMVPQSLSGTVAGVLGLNDVFKMSPAPVKAGTGATTTTPNVVDEYDPQGFWKAYQATGQPSGAKTSIATIAAGTLSSPISNLRAAEELYGLPEVPVTVEYAGIKSPATTTANVEWDLDSQYAIGMADEVQHFYYYDATTLTDSDLARDFNLWASQDIAKAASASLGECEYEAYLDGSMLIDDEVFAEAAAQGQTMFASSGDTGASCSVGAPNGTPDSGPPVVNYPASSPYVAGVGGTTLVTNATGSYDVELSWYAGGGGLSQFEYRPSWQAQVVPVTSGKTGDRGVPDVAMDANPTSGADVYTGSTTSLYARTGVEGVGGTSLSSPLALGVWARIESAYGNRLGFASPALYSVYLSGTCNAETTTLEQVCTSPAFHAPVAGDNGLYPETPGYNYDTGLGTFDTAGVIGAIRPFVPKSAPTAPARPAATAGNGQASVTWTAPTTGGTAITSYTVTSSPTAKTCTWTTGSLGCTVAGLKNGASYTFTVTATNGVGTSPASTPSAAVTPAGPPAKPAAPKAAAAKNASVTVTWTAPATDGSRITRYVVTSDTGAHSCTWSKGSLSCTVTGLEAHTRYTFTVVAENDAGTSPASTPSNAVTTT